jgi:hypothetical protein
MYVCLFVRLLLISFSLTLFRFHYLSNVIPLASVPCGVFWGVGERRAGWSMGQGGASKGGQHGWWGPAGRGPTRGRGDERRRTERGRIGRGGARARKDWTGGNSMGALCTRFTLVSLKIVKQQTFTPPRQELSDGTKNGGRPHYLWRLWSDHKETNTC